MPKLPAVTAREVQSALEKVGWVVHHQKGSHKVFFKQGMNKLTVPFHKGNIKPGTLKAIITASGLTVDQFSNLL